MTTRKKKKHGKRLSKEQKEALAHDIQLGVQTNEEIATSHGVSRSTVDYYKSKMKKPGRKKGEWNRGPKTAQEHLLDRKRAINLGQADSMMRHIMEAIIHHISGLNNHDPYYIKSVEALSKLTTSALAIRNALAFAPMLDDDPGVTEYDERLILRLMDKVEALEDPSIMNDLVHILQGGRMDDSESDTDSAAEADTSSGETTTEEEATGHSTTT